jgi:predicted O-methyltransferase YrrM
MRHPKEALLYVLLGKAEYYRVLEWRRPGTRHTCPDAKQVSLPFAAHMMKNTDIHEHLLTLYMLSVESKSRTIVELGTRSGESTIPLLFAAKRTGGKVFSYDIDECVEAKEAVASNGLKEYWQFTQSDDLKVEWDRPIDHVFIDTSHTYEQTTKELRKFEPHVRHGGVITMHDSVSYPAVREATTSYLKGRDDLTLYEYVNNNGLLVVFKT